jgi:transposase-like protein
MLTGVGQGGFMARSKLTPEDRAFIIERQQVGALTQKALAEKFSVSKQTIALVIRKAKSDHKADVSSRPSRSVVEMLRADIAKDREKLIGLNDLKNQINTLEQSIQKKEQALQLLEENSLKDESQKGEVNNENN